MLADCTADFDNRHHNQPRLVDAAFDFIGNGGNHLYGYAQMVAPRRSL